MIVDLVRYVQAKVLFLILLTITWNNGGVNYRNDFGRVCKIGSVHVPLLMSTESFSTVHQLVSSIEGRICKDKTVSDAICATFPGGSMTG